jgi:hypothetical protein
MTGGELFAQDIPVKLTEQTPIGKITANQPGRGECRTEFLAFPAGQSCRSALNSWAAQQHRPAKETKTVLRVGMGSRFLAQSGGAVPALSTKPRCLTVFTAK